MLSPYKRHFQENSARFQIVDHGVDHAQYFPGHGAGKWDGTVTGAGMTPKAAVSDALEQLAMSEDLGDDFYTAVEKEAEALYGDNYEKVPRVIDISFEQFDDEGNLNPEYNPESEYYYYVSIDYMLR